MWSLFSVISSRTDSKSIMRMKSGQMFAKEDLIRARKLLHDGALQLKNSTGRLKGSNVSSLNAPLNWTCAFIVLFFKNKINIFF